jgi:quercetin dioxygenase-like cupin family protein
MARSFWLFGARLTVHANHEDTGGRYDLIEGSALPGNPTPLHRHNRYAEQLYVLEGEFTIWAGGSTIVLLPGGVFTIPAGMAHVVAATGGGPARGLVVASPSGFARLIMATGTPDTGVPLLARPPDMALFERMCAEIGDEILGPPGSRPEPGPYPFFTDKEEHQATGGVGTATGPRQPGENEPLLVSF